MPLDDRVVGLNRGALMPRMVPMLRALALMFTMALGLAAFATAHAESYRVPQTGVPFLAVDVSQGWTARTDQWDNLQIIADDHAASLQLSMISDPRVDTTSMEDVAANIFKTAGAPPYARTEPDSIAGAPGQAFICVFPVNGVALVLRLIIVKLDSMHYATMAVLARQSLTPAESAALNDLVAHVSIGGR